MLRSRTLLLLRASERLPRASTPPRTEGAPARVPEARPTLPPSVERLVPIEPLRLLPTELLRLALPTELLRLGAPTELRLELLLRLEELTELRLELLLRLDELTELRLELLLLRLIELLWLLPEERLLLTELLCPPPPLRLPPLRCANAGVALSARAIITNVIAFEVFMLLLLSFLVSFSDAKILPFLEGISENVTYFSQSTHRATGSDYV